MPSLLRISAWLLCVSLASCGSAPPPKASSSVRVSPPPSPPCNAGAAQFVLGQPVNADLMERARAAAHAEMVRVLRHDQFARDGLRPGRLNLQLDAGYRIAAARCG